MKKFEGIIVFGHCFAKFRSVWKVNDGQTTKFVARNKHEVNDIKFYFILEYFTRQMFLNFSVVLLWFVNIDMSFGDIFSSCSLSLPCSYYLQVVRKKLKKIRLNGSYVNRNDFKKGVTGLITAWGYSKEFTCSHFGKVLNRLSLLLNFLILTMKAWIINLNVVAAIVFQKLAVILWSIANWCIKVLLHVL